MAGLGIPTTGLAPLLSLALHPPLPPPPCMPYN